MLGAFIILGLQPGPEFLVKHMDLAFGLAVILALRQYRIELPDVPAVAVPDPHHPRARARLLAPILLVLIMIGAYSGENNLIDVLFVFIFGALGIAMVRLGYNRPALLLGFVLGETIERYYQVSMHAYGPLFFLRPISITIVVLALIAILVAEPQAHRADVEERMRRGEFDAFRRCCSLATAVLLLLGGFYYHYPFTAFVFPLGAGSGPVRSGALRNFPRAHRPLADRAG